MTISRNARKKCLTHRQRGMEDVKHQLVNEEGAVVRAGVRACMRSAALGLNTSHLLDHSKRTHERVDENKIKTAKKPEQKLLLVWFNNST
eukprot:6211815-Pleurochrysis_carterae.AAC.2